MTGEAVPDILALARDILDIVLVSAAQYDILGQGCNVNMPLHQAKPRIDTAPLCNLAARVVFDAAYQDWDDIYRDIKAFVAIEGCYGD